MSTETIKIWMPVADADLVQKIFDRTQDPDFTIVKRTQMDEIPSCVNLELVCDSNLSLWFLAKRVESEQEFDRRMDKLRDDLHEKINSQIKK